MLHKGVETHIGEKRTEAVTLQYAMANWYEGVRNSAVIIEVLKSVYKLSTISLICPGMWW